MSVQKLPDLLAFEDAAPLVFKRGERKFKSFCVIQQAVAEFAVAQDDSRRASERELGCSSDVSERGGAQTNCDAAGPDRLAKQRPGERKVCLEAGAAMGYRQFVQSSPDFRPDAHRSG